MLHILLVEDNPGDVGLIRGSHHFPMKRELKPRKGHPDHRLGVGFTPLPVKEGLEDWQRVGAWGTAVALPILALDS